jgi:hypothetical protein
VVLSHVRLSPLTAVNPAIDSMVMVLDTGVPAAVVSDAGFAVISTAPLFETTWKAVPPEAAAAKFSSPL